MFIDISNHWSIDRDVDVFVVISINANPVIESSYINWVIKFILNRVNFTAIV